MSEPAGPRVLVLQHEPDDGPGYLGEALSRRGFGWRAVHLYRGEGLPALDGFDVVLIMGGAMNVYQEDRHPWLAAETRLIRQAVDTGRGVLGICLGGQLLARALDARVHLGGAPEIGLIPITLNEAGRRDPLFAGLPGLEAVSWHDDTFDIPDGAQALAASAGCAHQAFRFGPRAYGLQFHPEVSPEMLASWLRAAQPTHIDGPAFLRAVEARVEALQAQADCLIANFLDTLTNSAPGR